MYSPAAGAAGFQPIIAALLRDAKSRTTGENAYLTAFPEKRRSCIFGRIEARELLRFHFVE
jgi:hypothetical protein